MLKKVCCGGVIPTISLSLISCQSVVGVTLLLLLVTIMEFFPSGVCKKKLLPSLFLDACEGLNEKALYCLSIF